MMDEAGLQAEVIVADSVSAGFNSRAVCLTYDHHWFGLHKYNFMSISMFGLHFGLKVPW